MADRKVNIQFLGDASGLVDSIKNSVSAMKTMEAQSKGFATSMAGAAIKQLAPIGAAVAAAFASKRALQDFASSALPGADNFKAVMKERETAVTKLSAAFGEFLAPSVIKTSRMITSVATALTPVVRWMTALNASASNYFSQLGSNAVKAFRPLLPTVFKAFDAIVKWWNSSTDWKKAFGAIEKTWNQTWASIIDFTAPIAVAAAGTIEAGFTALKNIGTAALSAISSLLGTLPQGADASSVSFSEMGKVIQTSLTSAFITAEYAITQWRQVWDITVASVTVGIETIKSTLQSFGGYAVDVFTTIGQNIVESFSFYGEQIGTNLGVIRDNMVSVFVYVGTQIKNVFSNLGSNISIAFNAGITAMETNFKAFLVRSMSNVAKFAAKVLIGFTTGFAGWNAASVLGDFIDSYVEERNPFVKPDFSGMKGMQLGAFGGFASLPGIGGAPNLKGMPQMPGFEASQGLKDARASLEAVTSNFMSGLKTVMGDRFKDIEKDLVKLVPALKKNLALKITAPGAEMLDAPVGASAKLAAAATFGSREAYSAIVGGNARTDSQRQLTILDKIARNTDPRNQRNRALPANL